MSLSWPWALLALLVIPLVSAVWWLTRRRRRRAVVRVSSIALVRTAVPGRSRWQRRIPAVLLMLGLAVLAIGTARPQATVPVASSSATIMLALDVSGSMCSTDVKPNRITAAEQAASAFIRSQAGGPRIGLVTFAGTAVVLVPPTADTKQLLTALGGLTTSFGTAIGEGILTSLDAIAQVAQRIPVVFPAHPRTARNIEAARKEVGLRAVKTWEGGEIAGPGLWMLPAASYLDFLDLIQHAVLVITDSGGVQEETTFLGVPCLTYRATTERPVTVSMGTNRVVGCDPQHLLLNALEVLQEARHGEPGSATSRPPLWDGRTASRIVQILKEVWQGDLACAGGRGPR